jgi:hypothetical protein
MRAAEELRSALVFRAIRGLARRLEVPTLRGCDRALTRAIGDELRHSRLCAKVGDRLVAPPPRYDLAPVRARLRSLADPQRRLWALLLVEVAMGETVSTGLFAAGRRAAREPLTRATLTAILRDEIGHARFGWAALTALAPQLDRCGRSYLADEAARGLADMERTTALPALRRLDAGERFEPLLAELGVIAPEVRVETFYRAVERGVIPRLCQIGIDGAAAWRRRHHVSAR